MAQEAIDPSTIDDPSLEHHGPQHVSYDSHDAYERYLKRFLFDGSHPDAGVISPLVVSTIYKKSPSDIEKGDIVTTVSNLAYFGYEYQRVALDKDYSAEYSYK